MKLSFLRNKITICIGLSVLLSSVSFHAHASLSSKITQSARDLLQNSSNDLNAASVIVELETGVLDSVSSQGLFSQAARQSQIQTSMKNFRSSMSLPNAAKILKEYKHVPAAVVQMGDGVLEDLEANPFVKGIYPNKMRFLSLADSVDKVFKNQDTSRYNGGNQWAVAVFDTGVDTSHSFFSSNGASKVVSEACYSGGGISDPRVAPICPGGSRSSVALGSGRNCTGVVGCDHGSHVAGIAVGDRDNNTVDGVAHAGKLIPLQVFTRINDFATCNPFFSCVTSFDSDLIDGMERVYALRNTHKIAAINMSLGGGRFTTTCNSENRAFTNMVKLLKDAGIATIAASGNEGLRGAISFPACISDVIAVGATDDRDRHASFSNVDTTVDLFAPGVGVISSVPNESFDSFSGTSMAAPHVAGAFAVFRHAVGSFSANDNVLDDVSVDDILSVLKKSGPQVSASGFGNRRRLDVSESLLGMSESGFIKQITLIPIYQLLLLDD